MHVLLVGMGGVNAAFRNFTESSLAQALIHRGHTVTSYSYLDLHSPVQNLREENVGGVQVSRVTLGPIGFSMDLWRAMRRSPLPDIVHIHHLRNQLAWQVLLYYQPRGVPVILSPIGLLHDRFITDNRDDPFNHPIRYDDLVFDTRGFIRRLGRELTPRKHLRNWLTHFPLRRADHLIALSEFEKGLFVRLGIPEQKITVIPFGVDVDLADAALAQNQPPRDFSYTRPILLFIGQLKFRKGFDLLIRAAPRIRAEFPQASFVFMTHNLSQLEAFQHLVTEVGAEDYIFLVQQRASTDTEPEKMRQYAASDAFIYPTRYEGFGIPLLEAMACRVPIVSTYIPVIDEIIQDGETGVLSKLNDVDDLAEKIIQVLKDESLRQRITRQGRARVESYYTEALLGARTERVYNQVLAAAPRRASATASITHSRPNVE